LRNYGEIPGNFERTGNGSDTIDGKRGNMNSQLAFKT
jgi:hypothetical protein